AEHHRRVDDEGADATMRVVMHVGAADTDGVQLDLDHAGGDVHREVDLAELELVLLFEHERAHHGHGSYFPVLGRHRLGRLHGTCHNRNRVGHREVLGVDDRDPASEPVNVDA